MRTARRYGSADAAVHNRGNKHSSCCPSVHNQPRQHYTRRGRLLLRGRHKRRSHSEEGLDFPQFVDAIGGVIELLTAGCDDDGASDGFGFDFEVGDLAGLNGDSARETIAIEAAIFPRDLGSPRADRDSGGLGISRRGRTGASAAGFSSGRRIKVMSPGVAKGRLVRVAKVQWCGGAAFFRVSFDPAMSSTRLVRVRFER